MSKRQSQQRIDLLLVERNLAGSRNQAQRLIMAHQVKVSGQLVTKPGTRVPVDAPIEVTERLPYVSRGGLKLSSSLPCPLSA